MSKTKNTIETITEQARLAGTHAALALMAIAAVSGLTEAGEHHEAVINLQPAYAVAGANEAGPVEEVGRREKEHEGSHRAVSYGSTMRSEAVAGKA